MEQSALCTTSTESVDSTIHGLTVFAGGGTTGSYVIADVYCVVRLMMITAELNTYTLSFLDTSP